MIQLLLHLSGDFLTQNDWMAINKNKFTLNGWLSCFIHCFIYSFPFSFIYGIKVAIIILISHFLIDKFSLAKHWMKMMDIGQNGNFTTRICILSVVVDNSLHLLSNFLTIKYFL